MRGLSFYVFVFYNYVVATLVLLSLSLLFRRSRRLPSAISFVFFNIFLLALVGSPTLASAISNITPDLSFNLAIIFRLHLVIFRLCWIIGGLLIAAQYLLVSIWLILQTRIMEFSYTIFVQHIAAPVCLFATKDLSSFLLKPGFPLASVMFSGGLVSSLGSAIHTWGLHLKVAMGTIFLGDALYLGSVIGSVILSLGFYTVIWGKSREDSTRTVARSE
ncbi:hypothetical protein N665_0038s0004 [Sinapis alba]|nr:hypothetical protein N665_0038s0004 [Sinapis alba]